MDFIDVITVITQLVLTQEEYPGLFMSLSKQRTLSSWKRRDAAEKSESEHEGELELLLVEELHRRCGKGQSISSIKDQPLADNQQGI